MTDYTILLPIAIPFAAGIIVLLIGQRIRGVKEAIALLATAATLGLIHNAFQGKYKLVDSLGGLRNRFCLSAVSFQRIHTSWPPRPSRSCLSFTVAHLCGTNPVLINSIATCL